MISASSNSGRNHQIASAAVACEMDTINQTSVRTSPAETVRNADPDVFSVEAAKTAPPLTC